MNKKEKFYKNLSEFNIQEKPQKVEFRDAKTLDAMVKEANKIQDAGLKAAKASVKADMEWQDSLEGGGGTNELEGKIIIVADYVKDVQKENEKRLSDAKKEQDKVFKQWEKADKKADAAYKKSQDLQGVYDDMLATAKQHQSEMKSEIARFQNSAKSLGVDVSSKVAKYNAAASDVDKF